MPGSAGLLAGMRNSPVAQAGACHHESGPFHVSRTVVNGSTGRYIPYGISLTGLAHTDYAARVAQDEAGIAAAADFWCANTVRLQLRQANLVSITGHVNQAFLGTVTTEVRFAEARGLVVVLNLQWQLDRANRVESMPTQRSKAFWGSLTSHFGTDPNVIFDIYNEPAQRAPCGWAFWHDGGLCRGTRYIGMQALADYARANAPWACWDNAPVSAPRFLNYLRARGFGLIVTRLVKGQLIQSANLNDPTHFRSNWSCTDGLNQGVGHQAQQWFILQNT